MFVYDELRLIAMFFKVLAASFSIFMAIRILKKNRSYVLNQIFAGGFICWGLYLLGDSTSFILAPQSEAFFNVAQIIYGLQYIFLFICVYLLMAVGKIIRYGATVLSKKLMFIIEFIVLLICLVVLLVTTRISVFNSEGVINPEDLPPAGDFTLSEGLNLIAFAASGLPFLLYGHSVFLLLFVIRKTRDPAARRKLILMGLGIILLPLGLTYFIVLRMVFLNYQILPMLFGQIFFITSPICINYALKRNK